MLPTTRAIVAAFALAGASTTARSADIGQCAAPAAMTAMLKTEDQHSIVSAQLITNDKRLFGIIFTMSGDRKTGYILKADQPLGTPATQICVYNRLADVRLFDARKPGTPDAVLLQAPETDALRRCGQLVQADRVTKGGCLSLNTAIRRVESIGQRVVVQGFTVAKGADGAYRPDGTLTTMSGRIGGSVHDFAASPSAGISGDILYSSLPDGATVINAVLVYVEYTPYGLAALP